MTNRFWREIGCNAHGMSVVFKALWKVWRAKFFWICVNMDLEENTGNSGEKRKRKPNFTTRELKGYSITQSKISGKDSLWPHLTLWTKKKARSFPHLPSNKPSFFHRAIQSSRSSQERKWHKPLSIRFLHIFLLPVVRSPCIEIFIFGIL